MCAGLLHAAALAQTVSWNTDSSVTVSGGEKTFTTYMAPSDETVRTLMTHLNAQRVWYMSKGTPTGIFGSGFSEGSIVTFRLYAYDKVTRSKGPLLYGSTTQNGQTQGYWEVTRALPWGSTDKVSSHDIKKLIEHTSIFHPSGCSFTGKETFLSNWAWLGALSKLKGIYEVFASGKYLSSMLDTTTSLLVSEAKRPARTYLDNAEASCRTWLTPLQPVVAELTIKNATVKYIAIPGISDNNNQVTPYGLFNVWYNTDYSGLFRSDRPTVVAHRGFWRNAGVAQNSLGSIQAAATRVDVDVIELDVRSSKDKKAICFHDDMPQKVLQQTLDDYPNASIYDLTLATLTPYKLFDRFDLETSETLLTLENAFKYLHDHQITKPVNLDIGIPDQVPVDTFKVPGRPYFDAVFLEAVGAACRYGLTDRIIFKGKYTYDDPVWGSVQDTLRKYFVRSMAADGVDAHPIIAYTPKLGDDIADYETYFHNWLDLNKGRGIPFVSIVGMEVRLKNDEPTPINTFLKSAIPYVQSLHYNSNVPLRVGVFSETPTSCSGYWTKSAVEKYVNFNDDKRNNFDWVLNNGYDYLITDIPEVLTAIIDARQ
ncbi:glycerophosphodiester phosphodiesterase [Chitinophaga alhagiae]|uniref:glycerophosphodiester phosphodiesterase n=1 Tax=Chitinophaga alhagiae TaxID=2203219 RepID=UPI001300234B|nr:glycerophosphodiester phosphodiesterase family protein [Chitinophaga alhagiae]